MSIWANIFKKSYTEQSNIGTRIDSVIQANAYWTTRTIDPKKDPFALYTFDTEIDAKNALLEIPCIHIASDSQKLICTEVLLFGYYPDNDGHYEAFICGGDLSLASWEQARAAFSKHKGRCKNEWAPEKKSVAVPKVKAPTQEKVTFVKEEKISEMGQTYTYKIYKAPNAACAQEFLKSNPVPQKLLYILVQTPDGQYCRDIDGMYKQ